ncbi:S9 family peptidase [Bradyrhizobium iriomotense]|uniref:Dipeptidyl peptidase IV n=1 Tax=Bradyrhizobium iriomotense TaxID=441950 RepID=A0ABQ6BCV5_9BRAD|nr:DPP IV N-terminal domain-containing protein [Bradyrhizobium iriomotense]GLR92152.1 dipeptidyl peptidase IV [Bradyrhizobium iriomotense]
MKDPTTDEAAVAGETPVDHASADMSARYMRAAGLSPSLRSLLPDAFPDFRWLGSERLLAASDSKVLGVFRVNDGKRIAFGGTVESPENTYPNGDQAVSPDGAVQILQDGYNLTMLEPESGSCHRLTHDGTSDVAYGVIADNGSEPLTRLRERLVPPVVGIWSPDSRFFVTVRVDQRGLRSIPYVVASDPDPGGHRIPEVHAFRYALPGDTTVPTATLVIIDRRTRVVRELKVPPLILPYGAPEDGKMVWADDGRYLFVGVDSRDFRSMTVYRVDPETGTSHTVLVDRGDKPLRPFPLPLPKRCVNLFAPVGNGDQLVLVSERDGRAHLYLYDVGSGELARQLTLGAWSVVELSAVDARERVVFFSAVGREPGRDPYLRHFYRVSLDGGHLVLLTPEDADHEIHLSPTHGFFVDVHSTLSQAPTAVLRTSSGTFISELWRTDPKPLLERGWVAPERFSVTAADGRTVLHGTLYLPSEKKRCDRLPIIDSIYAGMQRTNAPVRFPGEGAGGAMALAQLGFAVFVLDARGTPLLDRAARDATWGPNFGSADVVAADHAAAVKQLAAKYDFLDPERVGIYGHSWGGYYTVRLMAQRPDVFKVGVSLAESSDNYMYFFRCDRWYGLPSEFPETYQSQLNWPLAAQIKGRLLLVAGDADDDTHPLQTILMAGALAKANRSFDMLILPGLNHSTTATNGYVTKRRWDYFVEHLLGVEPPTDVEVPDIRYW